MTMIEEAITITHLPKLVNPLLIAGFQGWGNALDISRGMVDYMIRKFKARSFGRLNPDLFYRFDENRPSVEIEDGILKKISPPGGNFYFASRDAAGRDLIFFKATEPNLRWSRFVDALVSLCQDAGVGTIISLGSMYDNILHTDTVISALASNPDVLASLTRRNILRINYKGPGAIHSSIHQEAQKRGIDCVSFWCHCPYYLQGTTHFGLLSRLGALLSSWGGFQLDTTELDLTWLEISKEIQCIIDKNPELQGMIENLRKAKVKESTDSLKKNHKVVHLEDFIKPK